MFGSRVSSCIRSQQGQRLINSFPIFERRFRVLSLLKDFQPSVFCTKPISTRLLLMDDSKMSIDDEFKNQLFVGAANGNVETVQSILDQMKRLINTTNNKGWTALMFAARNGQSEVARYLIDEGCSVDLLNNSGQTALDIATFWSRKEVVNLLQPRTTTPNYSHFFNSSRIDRASHRRTDQSWLTSEVANPKASLFVFQRGGFPVVKSEGKALKLARFSPAELGIMPDLSSVARVGSIGDRNSNEQRSNSEGSQTEDTSALTNQSKVSTDSPNGEVCLNGKSADGHDVLFMGEEVETREPLFGVAVDNEWIERLKSSNDGLTVLEGRGIRGALILSAHEAAIAGLGHAIFDWHHRYLFCESCGGKVRFTEGGFKRVCLSDSCRTHTEILNTSYPRTDPTVIMAVTSPDGSRLLLGRSGRMMKNMWSCLAGFMEPGESIEDGVRREVMEEAGVPIGRVDYHSSQPWPFPSQIMIGCIARAESETTKMDTNELEGLQWFTRQEVVQMLLRRHPAGLSVPPRQAMAHHLIKNWLQTTSKL